MLYKGGEESKSWQHTYFCPKVWNPILTFICTRYEKGALRLLTRVMATYYIYMADFQLWSSISTWVGDFVYECKPS